MSPVPRPAADGSSRGPARSRCRRRCSVHPLVNQPKRRAHVLRPDAGVGLNRERVPRSPRSAIGGVRPANRARGLAVVHREPAASRSGSDDGVLDERLLDRDRAVPALARPRAAERCRGGKADEPMPDRERLALRAAVQRLPRIAHTVWEEGVGPLQPLPRERVGSRLHHDTLVLIGAANSFAASCTRETRAPDAAVVVQHEFRPVARRGMIRHIEQVPPLASSSQTGRGDHSAARGSFPANSALDSRTVPTRVHWSRSAAGPVPELHADPHRVADHLRREQVVRVADLYRPAALEAEPVARSAGRSSGDDRCGMLPREHQARLTGWTRCCPAEHAQRRNGWNRGPRVGTSFLLPRNPGSRPW